MTKILLVCMANMCRSPMAEAVLRRLAHQAGLSARLVVDSAGTHVHGAGRRLDSRALQVLQQHHYPLGKVRSRLVIALDFECFDMILAMDLDVLETLTRRCPPPYQHKLALFLAQAPALGVLEVPDPYFGNLAGFERVLELCEAGAHGLIGHIAHTR